MSAAEAATAPAPAAPPTATISYLSKDVVRQRSKIVTEDLYVPHWDGLVRVRGLSLGQRSMIRRANMNPKLDGEGVDIDMEGMELDALVLGCVGADGRPIFAAGDKEWLRNEISGGGVTCVANRIFELSGMAGRTSAKKPEGSSEKTTS